MAELVTQISKTREIQRFFIGQTEAPGVQSVRLDYASNATLVKYLGQTSTPTVPRGGQVGNLSVNSILISNDVFYPLTGNSGINGCIIEDKASRKTSAAFTSGYLTNYSCRYQLGSLPEISSNFAIFGYLGQEGVIDKTEVNSLIDAIKYSNSNLKLKIPGPGGIDLNISDFDTNRVLSCEVQVNCLRIPTYVLGNRLPNNVFLGTPLEVITTFQVEVNDYRMKNMELYPLNEPNQAINFTIRAYDTNEIISNYSFANMSLISEAYETSVNGAAAINLQFRGYI
jgi:hypothetical protein